MKHWKIPKGTEAYRFNVWGNKWEKFWTTREVLITESDLEMTTDTETCHYRELGWLYVKPPAGSRRRYSRWAVGNEKDYRINESKYSLKLRSYLLSALLITSYPY